MCFAYAIPQGVTRLAQQVTFRARNLLLGSPGIIGQSAWQAVRGRSPFSGEAMGISEARVDGAAGAAGPISGTSGAPASCRLDSACLVAAALFWRTALSSASFGRLGPVSHH